MNFGGMGCNGRREDILGQMFRRRRRYGWYAPSTPDSAPRQQPKAATINVGLDITMAQAEEGTFTFSYNDSSAKARAWK